MWDDFGKFLTVVAATLGVAKAWLDRRPKPDRTPGVIIQTGPADRASDGGSVVVVLPPDDALHVGEPEFMSDEYQIRLAVDLQKNVRPGDRLQFVDGKYSDTSGGETTGT